MELKQLEKVQEARQLVGSVRDCMIMMENSSVKAIHGSIYYMLESTLEQAASLLEEVTANEMRTEQEPAEEYQNENKIRK